MKTLEELKEKRNALKRQLQEAYEALARRGGTALVSAAAQARFEETCHPRPPCHPTLSPHPTAGRAWTRC